MLLSIVPHALLGGGNTMSTLWRNQASRIWHLTDAVWRQGLNRRNVGRPAICLDISLQACGGQWLASSKAGSWLQRTESTYPPYHDGLLAFALLARVSAEDQHLAQFRGTVIVKRALERPHPSESKHTLTQYAKPTRSGHLNDMGSSK